MEISFDAFLKYLPDILKQLSTTEQLLGLAILVSPVVIRLAVHDLQQPYRAILSITTFFGALLLCFLLLAPQAKQLATELQDDVVPADEPIIPPSVSAGDGQVIADSSTRRLTAQELSGLSQAELRLARNEIYARNGRFFRSADLRSHFESFEWYQPFTWEPTLTQIELDNVNLIQAQEAARG